MRLTNRFVLLALGCLSFHSVFAQPAITQTQKTLSPSKVRTHITAKKDDCINADADCLLSVSPSAISGSDRTYNVTQICTGQFEYNYQKSLRDQIALRTILGRKFCNGVVTLSDMDLPFPTANGISNARDGLLLIDRLKSDTDNISKFLTQMRTLANQSISSTLSQTQRTDLNGEFRRLVYEIEWVADGASFQGYYLLNGSTQYMTVPIDDKKSQVMVSLMNLTSDSSGLNLMNLNISTPSGATEAQTQVDVAIKKVKTAVTMFLGKQPELQAAAKRDAIVTTIDISGDEFIVHKHRG